MILKNGLNGASLIGRCSSRGIYFVFSSKRKDKETPPHKTTHLQTVTNQTYIPSLQKSCFFSQRTVSVLFDFLYKKLYLRVVNYNLALSNYLTLNVK